MWFKYILYMKRPKTFVNSKKVPIDGGASPSMNIFGASFADMSKLLMATITIKKEIKRVTTKNSAAPTMNTINLRCSFPLLTVCANNKTGVGAVD